MNDRIKKAIERNFDIDNQEIARLIKEGNSGGILDNEEGYRVVWDLKINKFDINQEEPIKLRSKIIEIIKEADKKAESVEIDKIISELKEDPEIINNEIIKLLQDGIIYEPRPSRLRYLGE